MKIGISDRLWAEIKKSAESRGICFAITKEEAWKIFLSQDAKCAMTGISLDFTSSGYRGTASLDRIDSYSMYAPHNVQWVFGPINIMKGNHNQKYFKHLCNLVCKFDMSK